MKLAEQLGSHNGGPRLRKQYKKLLLRFLRRAAKRDPENAPKKPIFKGWS